MPSAEHAKEIAIYRAASTGVKPTVNDRADALRLLRVTQMANGLHSAEFLDAGDRRGGTRVENLSVSAAMNRQVEVWTLDSDGHRDQPLFWGEILGDRLVFQQGSESLVLMAQIHWAHCGQLLLGQIIGIGEDEELTIGDTGPQLVDYDLEFNPLDSDGRIVLNAIAPVDVDTEPYLWIDPEAQRTEGAREWHHAGTVSRWWLEDVVHALLKYGNPEETYVQNLNRSAIIEQLNTSQFVNNLRIKRGLPLPQMLTAALHPYGRGWLIDLVTVPGEGDDPPTVQPTWKFFVSGEGPERTIKAQAASGGPLDFDTHDVLDIDIRRDRSRLHNTIHMQGALIERQLTVELLRPHPESDDTGYSDDDPEISIGRRWVAGEAGDLLTYDIAEDAFTPIRDGGPDTPPTLDPNGSHWWDPRRRVAEELLTPRIGGERRPVQLEHSLDDGETWELVPPEWGWTVLSNEIGVYFTGKPIPYEILDENCRLRLTCTVRGDKRISQSLSDASSPSQLEMPLFVDVSDRFVDRKPITTGDTASVIEGPTENDQTDLNNLAAKSLANEQLVAIDGTITLRGLRTDFRLGDVITKLEGREISLNRLTTTPGRYPQIQVIEFINSPTQTTVLQIG